MVQERVPGRSPHLPGFARTVELLDLPVAEVAYCPHPAFPVGCFCRKPLPGLGVAAWVATGASLLYWTLVAIGMQIPPWYGLGYPVGALVTLYIVLRSTLRGAARVEWKGRTYDGRVNR